MICSKHKYIIQWSVKETPLSGLAASLSSARHGRTIVGLSECDARWWMSETTRLTSSQHRDLATRKHETSSSARQRIWQSTCMHAWWKNSDDDRWFMATTDTYSTCTVEGTRRVECVPNSTQHSFHFSHGRDRHANMNDDYCRLRPFLDHRSMRVFPPSLFFFFAVVVLEQHPSPLLSTLLVVVDWLLL